MKELYRCEDHRFGDGIHVAILGFRVLSTTPCGFWIDAWTQKRWVSASGRKRFAYPTKKEAIEGFRKRKARQIKILEGQLEQARIALARDWKTFADYTSTPRNRGLLLT